MIQCHEECVTRLRRLEWSVKHKAEFVAERIVLDVDREVPEGQIFVTTDVVCQRTLLGDVGAALCLLFWLGGVSLCAAWWLRRLGGVGPGQWERAARSHGQPGLDVWHKYNSDVTNGGITVVVIIVVGVVVTKQQLLMLLRLLLLL